MEAEDVTSIPQSLAWDTQARTISEGSLTSSSSSEQLALMGFAHRLYSVSSNNDPGIAEEKDVRNEARLLMSLSCIPPANITVESGRITPPSDASSCNSLSSRHRDSFRFSCPSLSLENRSQEAEVQTPHFPSSFSNSSETTTESEPAAMLGRVLKVDDPDALRLSSEAMARNIMQSYEKAIQWRIQSWVDSLSSILVDKEKELKAQGIATEENIHSLCESSEAMLIVRLREIGKEIKVIEACNVFNVLPQRVPLSQDGEEEPPVKRQRTFDEEQPEDSGLEETEYEYTVTHLLSFDCDLNIHAPAVGHASINLQVPGTMKGTFLSFEDGREHLADVVIDLNTDILASMIEKSSRLVVRSTVEALLKNQDPEEEQEELEKEAEEEVSQEAPEEASVVEVDDSNSEGRESPLEEEAPAPSCTPKRKFSEERVSGVAVITPRDSSSPSSFEDSDNEDRPVILSIPDNFSSGQAKPVLTPQPKRASGLATFATRLPAMKKSKTLPTVVTPSKTIHNFVEGDGPGPNLPTLVEVALQLHTK
mmetsp:Transcript_124919/g.349889  ORF Transcript_124919/g.349889 Transcript_124919/m.349889 type:complete len:537 (+) Transcript_124919:53-1663(+)